MKQLSLLNRIVFFANLVLVFLTFLAYVLPFLAPKLFPFLSVLTLILPFFLVVNVIFLTYWTVQVKKQAFLSGIILLLGMPFINKFYKFSNSAATTSEKDFVVMSYNVRLFNLFRWIEQDQIAQEMVQFINEKNPHILCIQEYSSAAGVDLKAYPYKFIDMKGDKIKTGHAIFSKFPIIAKGTIVFPHSDNQAIYADIKKGIDTIRVYNIHLQSIKITTDVVELDASGLDQKKSEYIFRRISKAFRAQQQQAEIIQEHKRSSKYPLIICGDMNNSAFSYVYSSIKGHLQDCFEQAGAGFGQTYHFKYYPARIDYIFCDPKMQVKEFTTYTDFKKSDHYPLAARLQME